MSISENTNQESEPQGESTQKVEAAPAPEKPAEDFQQKYLYLYADFENFKKRSYKERQDTIKFAFEAAASELLPVLDNLERALHFAKPDGDPGLVEGLKMVASQFKSVLEKQNLTEIPTQDRPFTPELHESVGQVANDKPAGTIIETHQKGYTLHGRLIRPARVTLSAGP